jgi:threonine synthase
MNFISTRKKSGNATFKEALFKGLAPDGGLYHPEKMSDLKDLFSTFNANTSFYDIARKVTYEVLKPEVSEKTADSIAKRAFTFTPKLRRLDNQLVLLELFHGPTCAFKDFGASFMAAAMEEFLHEEEKRTTILVATSGDTGSAVAKAFHGKKNIDVVILYPSGRVSNLQEKQLTTLGDNVIALEVKGAFDDCQRMVKEAFLDNDLNKHMTLTSANSINLGRLFPQSFYYIYGYSMLEDSYKNDMYFCVPSGNFGNLTAGVYAWKWGLATKGFIAATNVNDVVPEYLTTSEFKPRPSKQTLSNAMDVGNPSNFERLQEIFAGDWSAMKSVIHPEVVNDKETLKTISRVYRDYGIFIDPHTAVGFLASERYLDKKKNKSSQIMILSTAHPAKFNETVQEATGKTPDLPEPLSTALKLEKHSFVIEKNLKDLKDFLLSKKP